MNYSEIAMDCVALVQDFFSVDNVISDRDDIRAAISKIKDMYRLGDEYNEPLEHEIGYFCGMPEYC